MRREDPVVGANAARLAAREGSGGGAFDAVIGLVMAAEMAARRPEPVQLLGSL